MVMDSYTGYFKESITFMENEPFFLLISLDHLFPNEQHIIHLVVINWTWLIFSFE